MHTAPTTSPWSRVLAFLVGTYAATWAAWLFLHKPAAAGQLWAILGFIFATVWSPTLVALVAAFAFDGPSGARRLMGLVFRPLARPRWWYLIAVAVPSAAVGLAILVSRHRHLGAPFLSPAALPITLALQLTTGATGEELGWRGFLLTSLQPRVGARGSALIMAALWSLWHLPSFFMPGLPQALAPVPFLLMVFAFGVFLALLFKRTGGHLLATMMAHFTLNFGLAAGGAAFTPTLVWTLAVLFSAVAVWSLVAPAASLRG